jgi:hypothetical protein
MIARIIACTAALAALSLSLIGSALAADRAEVFVLGSLYSRHQSVPAYDLDALRRIILTIDPDVLIVDCTPTEVREQKVHASKIEYPNVIFPLAQQHRYRVYAAEPDEPQFTQIVQSIVQARGSFDTASPQKSAALDEYESATYAALKLHWQSPATVHDDITAAALDARKDLDDQLYGPVQTRGGVAWNEHWAAVVLKAADENPGKRLLAVAGLENRRAIESLLTSAASVRIVNMENWLREHAER